MRADSIFVWRRWSVWLLLAGFLTSFLQGAAPARDQDRLRKLVRLPRLSFQVGLNFDPIRGLVVEAGRSSAARDIADIRKLMHGDSADAPRYYEIGIFLLEMGDVPRATQSFGRAVSLYRQQSADQSTDGSVLTAFGDALAAAGELAEAERVLRQAVALAPKDWSCHLALGRLLTLRALSVGSLEGRAPAQPAELSGLVGELSRTKPSAQQLEKAQKAADDAIGSLDRAVELAPTESRAYVGRASGRSTRSLLQAVVRMASGDDSDPTKLWIGALSKDALSDLQQAAKLDPTSSTAISTAVWFEVFSIGMERGFSRMDEIMSGSLWSSMPDETRRNLGRAMDRLADIGQAPEPRQAAGDLEKLGMIQYLIVRDLRGGESTLRRAVSLDPGRDQAWETLTVLLVSSERSADLVAVCQDRLKAEESARNRVLLAKAYEHLNQVDRVLAEASTAQKRYPEDPLVNLTLAAAVLKASDDSGDLRPVARYLNKCQQALGDPPPRDMVLNLLLLQGLYYGLVEMHEEARASLHQLLELDRSNAEAKEALQVIE